MRKILITLGVLMFAFMFVTTNDSFARGGFGRGNCDCYDNGYYPAKSEEFKKFREETLSLRQTLSNKRFELEKESIAEHPDTAKIDNLKQEIKTLKDKIYEIKKKYNVNAKGFKPRCY